MRIPHKNRIFKTDKLSVTRPGLALSMRELNTRFVQGKEIPKAKAPIHEPNLDNGIHPMRVPYADYSDVMNFSQELQVRLNKAESLLTDARAKFDKVLASNKQAYRNHLIAEAKKQLSEKPL